MVFFQGLYLWFEGMVKQETLVGVDYGVQWMVSGTVKGCCLWPDEEGCGGLLDDAPRALISGQGVHAFWKVSSRLKM